MERFFRRKQRAFFKALLPRCGMRAGPAVGKEEGISLLTQRLAAPSREGRGTNRHALGCIISPRPKNGRGWYIAGSATSIPFK